MITEAAKLRKKDLAQVWLDMRKEFESVETTSGSYKSWMRMESTTE